MRTTGWFVVLWLATGAAFDFWRHLIGEPTITGWFRWLAHRYPWSPCVVIAAVAFAMAHLYLEDLFGRTR